MVYVLTKQDVAYSNILPYSFQMTTDLFANEKRKKTTTLYMNRMFESNKRIR